MRFRRRVRILPGLSLNFSKSGVSVSAGIPGLSITSGKRGVYLNAGIPGTGIYDRKRLDVPAPPPARAPGGAGPGLPGVDGGYTLVLDGEGKLEIEDASGLTVSDPAVLRHLHRQPGFKDLVRDLGERLQKQLEAATADFVEIYRKTPPLVTTASVQAQLAALEPDAFEAEPFAGPRPSEEDLRKELAAEAEARIHDLRFWSLGRRRREFVERELPRAVAARMKGWEGAKAGHDAAEAARRKTFETAAQAQYEKRRGHLLAVLNGDPAVVEASMDTFLGDLKLAEELSVDHQYDAADRTIRLDVALPGPESLPQREARLLVSGKVSVREKSDPEKRREYATAVCGLAFYFAGHAFNTSPAVRAVEVSGHVRRASPATGLIGSAYLYSVRFDRDRFARLDVPALDPMEALQGFDHRIHILASAEMKPVQPFPAPGGAEGPAPGGES